MWTNDPMYALVSSISRVRVSQITIFYSLVSTNLGAELFAMKCRPCLGHDGIYARAGPNDLERRRAKVCRELDFEKVLSIEKLLSLDIYDQKTRQEN